MVGFGNTEKLSERTEIGPIRTTARLNVECEREKEIRISPGVYM